jgi:hypothetical protein
MFSLILPPKNTYVFSNITPHPHYMRVGVWANIIENISPSYMRVGVRVRGNIRENII